MLGKMICPVCERDIDKLTKHHLVPRSRHSNGKTIKRHGKEGLNKVIWVCRECHSQLHALLTEKEMDEYYFTFEKLMSYPDIAKYAKWIKGREFGKKLKVKSSNDKKRRR